MTKKNKEKNKTKEYVVSIAHNYITTSKCNNIIVNKINPNFS